MKSLCEQSQNRIHPQPARSPLSFDMCQKRTLLSLTNFTSDELIAFSRQAEPFFTANCKRGKKPALSCLDHICLYLMYFKSGITMEGTASYLGLAENKVDTRTLR
eukprot:TRINITY_DN6028_c0_g1_i2.p1 TRINITY_DN6028_c0_g1~~TRINITY_DN6028_c0_g1_i2.p1  ORF type:complete len:105 (-),score=3.55 TRINITY_DN6028_c0_g1_i2:50-364(-)